MKTDTYELIEVRSKSIKLVLFQGLTREKAHHMAKDMNTEIQRNAYYLNNGNDNLFKYVVKREKD